MTSTTSRAPAPQASTACIDAFLPCEYQYEIDDDGELSFTPAGEAWWRPRFVRWGYTWERSLPVEAFEDISATILQAELCGAPPHGAMPA